jgi:flagellar protein FlbD
MITVTRINNHPIIINADLIEFIESTPDTIITMTNGKKMIVKDSVNVVVEKVVQYKRKCFFKSNWEVDSKQ